MREFSSEDRQYMLRALQVAERGLYTTMPNPRVGCVIVKDGKIIGEAWHRKAGEPHAEVLALEQAAAHARGATVYVTLEPCCHHGRTPPCSQALIDAGVAEVVVAMEDPNPMVAGRGIQMLRDAGIAVQWGLMQDQAEALNPGFIQRMREGRPFLRAKLAMSLDGRTAMASGESKWITGMDARTDVHRLRARSCAIMTGIGTVLADDPSLTVRLEDEEQQRQPLRVVLDPHLSMSANAKMLSLPGRTLIATAIDDEPELRAALEAKGAEVICLPAGENIDLYGLMKHLASMGINEILLETGAVLSGSVLRSGLIDELVVYMAPKLMGSNARGLFHTPGLIEMADAVELEIQDIRAVGRDWRITSRIVTDKD